MRIEVGLLLLLGFHVSAEPVAPLSKHSKQGIRILQKENWTLDDLREALPSGGWVGIPIYPGATFDTKILKLVKS